MNARVKKFNLLFRAITKRSWTPITIAGSAILCTLLLVTVINYMALNVHAAEVAVTAILWLTAIAVSTATVSFLIEYGDLAAQP